MKQLCLSLLIGLAPSAVAAQTVVPQPAFGELRFERPLALVASSPGEFLVAEQGGKIWRVFPDKNTWSRALALDISGKVRQEHNEEGLLSIALQGSDLFLYYSASKPRRTVLSRMAFANGKAQSKSETVLLDVDQPYGNHNGGTVLFGPDGYLYLSLGDGGSGGDPHNHGQDLSTLLGSIIRINPSQRDPGKAYQVPKDNPFVGRADARPEIWAYGLRNVWRMSFDRQTGQLWAADVGQNQWEEIDIIVRGGNYGWNIREGRHTFKARPSDTTLIDPVWEYDHGQGVSITGGYVYRGKKLPALGGAYIYGDFGSGRIWALRVREGSAPSNEHIATGKLISSFGEDSDGELLFTSFDGAVYRLSPPGR